MQHPAPQPAPSHRLAALAAKSLTAGVALTLGFAWAPALWDDGSGGGYPGFWTLANGRSGFSRIHTTFGADFIEAYGVPPTTAVSEADTRRFTRVAREWTGPHAILAVPGLTARELRGWPFRCLAADYLTFNPNASPTTRLVVSALTDPTVVGGLRVGDAIRGGSGRNYGRVLPLTPRWGGLLADIALFASAFAAFSTTLGALRRRRRRNRGLCPACGYDRSTLSTTTPCPECGAPTASSPRTP